MKAPDGGRLLYRIRKVCNFFPSDCQYGSVMRVMLSSVASKKSLSSSINLEKEFREALKGGHVRIIGNFIYLMESRKNFLLVMTKS